MAGTAERYSRMMVEGRGSDHGPFTGARDEERMETLPPKYEEATEPLPGQTPFRATSDER